MWNLGAFEVNIELRSGQANIETANESEMRRLRSSTACPIFN